MSTLKYKAVIFDFDDTLVESRAAKWAQHTHVAKKFYDIDLKEEKIKEHWGKSLNHLVSEIYERADTVENTLKVLKSTQQDFPKKVYPGSVDVVTELLNQNIKVGILSATTREFLLGDLMRLKFPVERFSVIQSQDETTVHKPDPDVFLPLLDKLKKEGIKKKDMVYVGDSLYDQSAAVGAGIDFIALTTGLFSEKDFKEKGAAIILKDIRELKGLLIG